MRKSRLSLSIGFLAAGLAVMVGGVAAWACVPGAKITPSPGSGGLGTQITVKGETFDPAGSPVKIYWDGAGGKLLGQVGIQANREFSFTFTVDSTTVGNTAGGSHVISATQLDKDGKAYNPVNALFKVEGQAAQRSAPNTQGVAVPEDPGTVSQPAGVAQPAPVGALGATAAQPARAGQPAAIAAPGTSAAPARAADGATAAPATAAAPGVAPAPEQARAQAQADAFRPAEVPATADETSSRGTSPWLMVPLALLALGFLAVGTGIFLSERKRVRVEA